MTEPSPEYREAEQKLKNTIRTAKRNFEKKLARESNRNNRPFYAYLKRKTKSKSTVDPLVNAAGDTISDQGKMAEELNTYFSSVFTCEDQNRVPIMEDRQFTNSLEDMVITEKKVRDKIRKLRPASAPGPDSIGAGLLQEMEDELAPALTALYRKLLDDKIAPRDWKTANVTPIFSERQQKRGCKVFESLPRDEIVQHLERNNLLSTHQHGFVNTRSCATNLIEFFDKITLSLDDGDPADIVFLDFAKAFDKVPTRALLKKVRAHGITGKVAAWIENWLTDRQQRVVLNGRYSTWKDVLSGVPQGSIWAQYCLQSTSTTCLSIWPGQMSSNFLRTILRGGRRSVSQRTGMTSKMPCMRPCAGQRSGGCRLTSASVKFYTQETTTLGTLTPWRVRFWRRRKRSETWE